MHDSLSGLRHAARGCLNSIKLCVSALELECTHDEQVEFIEDVIRSSEKLCGLIDDLAMMPDPAPSSADVHGRV